MLKVQQLNLNISHYKKHQTVLQFYTANHAIEANYVHKKIVAEATSSSCYCIYSILFKLLLTIGYDMHGKGLFKQNKQFHRVLFLSCFQRDIRY